MVLLMPIQGIEQSKINDEMLFSLLFKSAKIINIGIAFIMVFFNMDRHGAFKKIEQKRVM